MVGEPERREFPGIVVGGCDGTRGGASKARDLDRDLGAGLGLSSSSMSGGRGLLCCEEGCWPVGGASRRGTGFRGTKRASPEAMGGQRVLGRQEAS